MRVHCIVDRKRLYPLDGTCLKLALRFRALCENERRRAVTVLLLLLLLLRFTAMILALVSFRSPAVMDLNPDPPDRHARFYRSCESCVATTPIITN